MYRVLSATLKHMVWSYFTYEESEWRVACHRLVASINTWALTYLATCCPQALRPPHSTGVHNSALKSVLGTYLDDPAGMLSKVGQALQLAQGCDRAGKGLEYGG